MLPNIRAKRPDATHENGGVGSGRIRGIYRLSTPEDKAEEEVGNKFLRALESSVSAERWAAYRSSAVEDGYAVAGLYAWNIALCEALYPVMNAVEIALRNRVFAAGAVHFDVKEYLEVNCWLDAVNPRPLLSDQVEKVSAAKKSLKQRLRKKFGKHRSAAFIKAQMTPGRLISELHFGFWTYLFDGEYGAGPNKPGILWPTLLPIVFPQNPSIQRGEASRRLVAIRQLRNRVFHHEEIWGRENLWEEYTGMLTLLSWMSPESAAVLKEFCQFPAVYREPPTNPAIVPRHFRFMIRRLAREFQVPR